MMHALQFYPYLVELLVQKTDLELYSVKVLMEEMKLNSTLNTLEVSSSGLDGNTGENASYFVISLF